METLWKDLQYGARMLARSPGFTALAVISLALGIGVNSSVFSVVNAVLFRPLPVRNPQELASVFATGQNGFLAESPLSYPDYEDYRDQSDAFTELFAYSNVPLAFDTGEKSQFVFGTITTGNYFTALGVNAALGRTLASGDDVEGAEPVVVLGHDTWRRRFGANPGVVGQTIRLNGTPVTVIGVAPAEFKGLLRGLSPEFWIPTSTWPVFNPQSPDRLTRRAGGWLWVVGRLQPSLDLDQAQARLGTVAQRLEQEYPDTNEDRGVQVFPTEDVIYFPSVDNALHITSAVLMVVVGLILVIACANVANMLLARATSRQKEVAIRSSLGASRGRIVRQLLTESVLLSLLAGGLGLLIAVWSNRLLTNFQLALAFDVQIDLGLGLDGRVFGFTLAAAFLTALLFGLVPALQSAPTEISSTLQAGRLAGGRSKNRFRNVLVVAQVALSLLLLIGAGLSVRSLQNVHKINPGFDPTNVATAQFAVELRGLDDTQGQAFYDQLAERVEALPGVQSVSYAALLPLTFTISIESFLAEGQESLPENEWPSVDTIPVGPRYFETMRIPLLSGRGFRRQDDLGAPRVVVVNEALAKQFWPGQVAIGKRVRFESDGPFFEVVGMVPTGRYRTLGEQDRPYVYKCILQNYQGMQTLVARTEGQMDPLLAALRTEARAIDDKVPAVAVQSLEQAIGIVLLLPRMSAVLFGLFGVLGLILASVGIYGVISYGVARRTHEFGIRMALGAQRSDVLKMVLKQGLVLTGVGVTLGLLIAVGLTRFLSAVLYGVTATDLLTFVGISGLLISLALLACYIPARRATRVDPMVALRYE